MQEGEALERAMASIADSWSERDPSAAVKWLGQIEDPAIRSDSLAVATRNWASDDPEAAGEWIRSIEPSPEMDRPVTSYVKTIFNKNPQEAMIYASRVSDDKRRNKLLEGLVQHWMKRDPEGAEAFLSP
jgi:hypothetical protein